MPKEALKHWRLIIPGMILLGWAAPLLLCEIGLNVDFDPKNIVALIAVIVLGGLYNLFNLRGLVMAEPIGRIQKNIRDRLAAPYKTTPGFERLNELTDKEFLRIFYSIIDNDKSLSDQSNDVRLNGLYLSTACDIRVISGFAIAVYWLVAVIIFWASGQISQCAQGAVVVAFGLFLLSPWLVTRATKEHLRLGDEQLAHITGRKELAQSLEEKLQHSLQLNKLRA